MSIDRLHVIDFEGHPRYGVVEFGVVTLTAAGITECVTDLCAPVGEIPPADTRVHGITMASAAGRLPFREEYQRFVSLRESGLFCAHNAIVESNLLRSTWACPPFCPDWGRPGGHVADWGPWLDTLKLARNFFPDKPGHSLGELSYAGDLAPRIEELAMQHCPAGRTRAHAALYDALATAVWLHEVVGWQPAIDWFIRSVGPEPQQELFG